MTEGYNVIITIGPLMGDATALKAKQYLDIKFAIIDTTRGKEIALKLIGNGCDILFAISGAAVNGVLLAAGENNLPAVGADLDVQPALITSAMKNVDVAVYNYLKSVVDRSVQAGISTGTLQNGGVGLSPFHD